MARVRETYLGVFTLCLAMVIAPFVFFGCGGGSQGAAGGAYEPLFDPAVAPDTPAQNSESKPERVPLSFEDLINSELYAGHLVVILSEAKNPVKSMDSLLSRFPGATLSRAVDANEKELDRARAKLEKLSGKKLQDWNLIYHIETPSPASAVALFRELKDTSGVAKVYPAVIASPTGILDTPSLTGYQTYLEDEAGSGGLNAEFAWGQGVRGEGVYIVDDEYGINLYHEDLRLIDDRLVRGGSYIDFPDCNPGFPENMTNCQSHIAHGTAVAGILVGQNNDHGVAGFAPLAHYVHSALNEQFTFEALRSATDEIDSPTSEVDEDIEPGSIWVIEVQTVGRFGTSDDCESGEVSCLYGDVPTEILPENFASIEQATAYGVTVVASAGNGQMDLDNPELYTDWSVAHHNLAVEDAGSIMVGASEGANEEMAFWSNCGTRVNSFAWGQGVVTTGYPFGLYGWTGALPSSLVNDPLDPNNFYVDNFGGTSSAAAMVGGAAALVQSYARADLGHRRYIMPSKMREIIVGSGVPQADTGGCNIGTQPRIDVAFGMADSFLASARTSYPELDSGELLTEERMISLRALGVGIICKEFDPVASDPTCPDSAIFPAEDRLAKDLDFDGDGRADLVQWTESTWKIDLSSRGAGGDNFGAWDIEIEYEPIAGQWVWPYVIDMNRDGRTDFVVYDKENGKWYIAFTNSALIRNGTWHGWDWEIDYSTEWTDILTRDPFGPADIEIPDMPDARYSRPVPGDYNNDGWIDIAIACSDGNWRIDHGGQNRTDFGAFDRTVRYLSDAQLAEAPGWAYLAFTFRVNRGGDTRAFLGYKVPDGLPEAGRMAVLTPISLTDTMMGAPFIYGGNDCIPSPGDFSSGMPSMSSSPGIKDPAGSWNISLYESLSSGFLDFPPAGIFGGSECRPSIGDFDGDGGYDVADIRNDDRAVMCPNEWLIVYSSSDRFAAQRDADGIRRIPLGYDESTLSLPGRPYAGGVSYESVRNIIELFQLMNPGIPPPIPVDMMTIH